MRVTYTVIAKSIPEYSTKYGGLFTCTLGYCHESNSLIRVYPIPVTGMKKWHTYSIEIEKNRKDSREESWKLSSYAKYENWIGLDKDVMFLGKVDRKIGIQRLLQTNQIFPSISTCNQLKISIGIIPLSVYNLFWDVNGRYVNTNQLGLFEDVALADWASFTKDTKEYEARIEFVGDKCVHNLQYNDWGVTEWLRKFKGQYPINDAFRNLRNKNFCLIGNMLSHRNNWIALDLY